MSLALYKGITAAVITVSDSCSRNERKDLSGELLVKILKSKGAHVLRKEIVSDEVSEIEKSIRLSCDSLRIKLILTTGGTGLGPRDVTPETTVKLLDRQVPGIIDLARREGFKKTKNAALSRAVAGIRKNSLIINLPGSPQGARESFNAISDIIPHAFAMMKGQGHGK
ncbi:MAG TPA: MogA/MoaB family molybdenum cofactor biosynthesis protein [Candidatus Omnitrophota bacterium]|nr:MogA/MoaB family molybdenum cofactor biosynthesis protein [Candidatus Omnitrophota bacterium]